MNICLSFKLYSLLFMVYIRRQKESRHSFQYTMELSFNQPTSLYSTTTGWNEMNCCSYVVLFKRFMEKVQLKSGYLALVEKLRGHASMLVAALSDWILNLSTYLCKFGDVIWCNTVSPRWEPIQNIYII